MAPAASITIVWQHRAAHGALVVRLAQLTPAFTRAKPCDGTKRTESSRPRRQGPSYKYCKPAPCRNRAHTAPRRTRTRLVHACTQTYTRTRAHTHSRAKKLADRRARHHARAHTKARMRRHARAYAHTRAERNAGDACLYTTIGRCIYTSCDGERERAYDGPKSVRSVVCVVACTKRV